jgi:hypothetical protein
MVKEFILDDDRAYHVQVVVNTMQNNLEILNLILSS